jgi:hypothetical protein
MDVIEDQALPLQVVDFPGGQHAFGKSSSPADGIVQTPGENAVLVAHPVDRQVYYYKEGMAAPMGSFKNYDRAARAVLAVDRTLRETRPGQYETVGRLTQAGTYDIAFFLEAPRLVHCFPARVMPASELAHEESETVAAELLPDQAWQAGQSSVIRFRLKGARSGKPITGMVGMQTLTVLSPGFWKDRITATEVGDGVYSVEWLPPKSGAYFILLEADWDVHKLRKPAQLMLRVNK